MVFVTVALTLLMIVTAVTCNELNSTSCYQRSREHIMRKDGIHKIHRGSTRDYVLRGRVYRNETTGSFLACAGFCLQDEACKSFIFCKDDERCELNTAVRSKDLSNRQQSSRCLFFDEECRTAVTITTQPSNPASFKFILSELTTPFRLRFTVRAKWEAAIALARSRQEEEIFCHIIIGGWYNRKATIVTVDSESAKRRVFFEEENQLSASEYRAFWIEYTNGLVRVGKGAGGGDSAPFMQLNVSASYRPVPSKIDIAISTLRWVSGEWVFDWFCD